MKPDSKREYCGCLLRKGRRGGGKVFLQGIVDELAQVDNLWAGEYLTSKNHTPSTSLEKPLRRGRGKDAPYVYSIFAIDVPVSTHGGTLLLAPYFTLARELVDRLRDAGDVTYFRVSLGAIEKLTEKSEKFGEQVCLQWTARIEGDGTRAKIASVAGSDVLRSEARLAILGGTRERHLRFTTQKLIMGSNRTLLPEDTTVVLRKHEVRVAFDIHGNVRLKSPLDEVGILALKDFFSLLKDNGAIETIEVCPVYRQDETSTT